MAASAKKIQIPTQPLAELDTLIDRNWCERSLRHYMEQAWSLVDPDPFVPGWHIDAISEHLEAVTKGQIRNLVINVPPRYTKSLQTCVFWPTWEWGPKNLPGTRWLTLSYSASLSLRDAAKARQLIQTKWYQDNWGHRFRLSDDTNAKGRYNTDHNGYRVASSIGGMGTGEGGGRLVIDDPHNIKDQKSGPRLQQVLDWWDGVMPTRRNNPKHSATVVIMQRSRFNDLTGHIQEMMGKNYEYLVLPGEFDSKRRCQTKLGWKDPRKKEGEPLWPEQFDKAALSALKTELGPHNYAAQIQQNPTPWEGGLIKRSWWKFYDTVPNENEFDMICQSWDMAFKDLDTSSYVVGLVWGMKGAESYLLDRVREHLSFTETIQAVTNMTSRWPTATAKFVEDKANGPAVIDALSKKITGLIACTPVGSKESRVWSVTPEIQAGNVILPHPSIAPWVTEYIQEMSEFPLGAHDDDADATSQALMEMRKRRHLLLSTLPEITSITRSNPMGSMSTR